MQAPSRGYSPPRDQMFLTDPDSVPAAEAPLLPWTSIESVPVSVLDLGAGLAEVSSALLLASLSPGVF